MNSPVVDTSTIEIRQRITDAYIKLLQLVIKRGDPSWTAAFMEIAIVGSDKVVNASLHPPRPATERKDGVIEPKQFLLFNYTDPNHPDPEGDLSEVAYFDDLNSLLDELVTYQLRTLKIIVPAREETDEDVIEYSEELDWHGPVHILH